MFIEFFQQLLNYRGKNIVLAMISFILGYTFWLVIIADANIRAAREWYKKKVDKQN